MNKAVLISIKPKWVEKIANGEKTIEVRKTRPNAILPLKCYIYCTKPKFEYEDLIILDNGNGFYGGGKVIGEFVLHYIFPISFYSNDAAYFDEATPLEVAETCLTDRDIVHYLGNGKTGYGWRISDLKIYDTPKPITDFKRWNRTEENAPCAHVPSLYGDCKYCKECNLIRPPQSWCYVEELEECNDG